jgi:hypothetical protein
MAKREKLLERLISVPNDLTWDELVRLLSLFGFSEIAKGKTGGSRRKFSDANNNIISLHKPHPKNIVKVYAILQVIDFLKEKGHIKNE